MFRSRISVSFGLAALALVALAGVFVLTAHASDHYPEPPGSLEWMASSDRYEAHGKFESWHFTEIEIPDGDLEKGKVTFEVDLASVWEKSSDLAAHLRNADFFEVETFATSTVTIDRVKKTGEHTYEATATIELHGTTGEVPVSFEVTGTEPLHIKGEATMSRLAFGVGEEGSISDEVKIVIDADVK